MRSSKMRLLSLVGTFVLLSSASSIVFAQGSNSDDPRYPKKKERANVDKVTNADRPWDPRIESDPKYKPHKKKGAKRAH